MKKRDSIRFKVSGGLSDLQDVLKNLESYAELKNFEIVFTKTKQRFNTPLWDLNLGMIQKDLKD